MNRKVNTVFAVASAEIDIDSKSLYYTLC